MSGTEKRRRRRQLLSNAIKFTDAGGKVTLEAMGDGTSVHIAVRDTGVGISPEDQAVTFDEFKQVGTDYTRLPMSPPRIVAAIAAARRRVEGR